MGIIKKAVKAVEETKEVTEEIKSNIINPTDTEHNTVSPKYHYANMVRELFKLDKEVKLTFNEDTCTIDMVVDNEIKALAIRRLLPEKKILNDGTVTINVELNPTRFGGNTFLKDTVYEAFKGNPLFDYEYFWSDEKATTNPYCWVVMRQEPVVYPESNLHQIYGYTVDLPEKIATEVIGEATNCIYYCTNDNIQEMPEHNAKKFNEE